MRKELRSIAMDQMRVSVSSFDPRTLVAKADNLWFSRAAVLRHISEQVFTHCRKNLAAIPHNYLSQLILLRNIEWAIKVPHPLGLQAIAEQGPQANLLIAPVHLGLSIHGQLIYREENDRATAEEPVPSLIENAMERTKVAYRCH